MNTYGEVIDLSAENRGEVDLCAARDAGVVACYFRGTFGSVDRPSDIDVRVHEFANKARRAKLPFGIYSPAYVRHNKPQDAEKQAADAVNLALELGADLICAPDWEWEKGDKDNTEAEALEAITRWVARAEALQCGKPPLLYSGPGWWCASRMRMLAKDLARCPLWCSDAEASRAVGAPLAMPPWSAPAMHQYAMSPTSSGRVGTCPGIDGYVDRSILLQPLDSLRW